MRTLLSFVSLIAVGLIAASAIALVGRSTGASMQIGGLPGGFIEYRSLTLGLVLGFVLAMLTQVAWSEVPRRAIAWLLANEATFYRVALALLLLAFIIYV